jgi:hypothetical protein
MFANNLVCSGMQVQRSAVITHPRPGEQYATARSGCQRVNIRKATQPIREFFFDAGYLRLLEHDFAYKNDIGIGRVAPGKSAPMDPVPSEDSPVEMPNGIVTETMFF